MFSNLKIMNHGVTFCFLIEMSMKDTNILNIQRCDMCTHTLCHHVHWGISHVSWNIYIWYDKTVFHTSYMFTESHITCIHIHVHL